MEEFVYRDKKKLRKGYTTGTCAALAAKAAVSGLLSGKIPEHVSVMTPAGKEVSVRTLKGRTGQRADGGRFAECAVKKDAGDDPDATDGLLIFCRAEFGECPAAEKEKISIRGGDGVGRVTKKGLNQPPGEAAINSVPRDMMRRAALEILEEAGEERPVILTVSVPGGQEAAKKTFNPVLGIEGGISILGTSGIVEPMSEEALVDTIRAQMSVLKESGRRYLAAVPGNLGSRCLLEYVKTLLGGKDELELFSESVTVCSNFIGKTIDLAAELGFSGILFSGHVGKLVKLGNGIMNTHSKEGDGRMDTLVSCALSAGAGLSILKEIQSANTAEEAVEILRREGFLDAVLEVLLRRISAHVRRRAPEGLSVEVLLFSQETGFLGMTEGAEELLRRLRAEIRSLAGRETQISHSGIERGETKTMEEKHTYETDYELLCSQLAALAEGVEYDITNLANGAALLYETMENLNWAGFYLYQNGSLLLGPFQGKTACTKIAMGRGVCGAAAEREETVLVEDVHQFPGHIACDCASNSEIVVPIFKDGTLYGVLDLDSLVFSRFSSEDQRGLEAFVRVLEKQI